MPKMKTKSAAKKRFSFTGTGKVKRGFAKKRHHLGLKSQSMKRKARGAVVACSSDVITILKHMPYAAKR
ncbi:MAG: 50S ribosomal protein L35 [Alphaproteobacteria bacterium]